MSKSAQEAVDRGLKPVQGTWELNGEEYPLTVEVLSHTDWTLVKQYATLSAQVQSLDEDSDKEDIQAVEQTVEQLDSFSWEDDGGETDFVRTLINNTLIEPEVDPDETEFPIVQAILNGMLEAWKESPRISEARGEMPLEGNP